MKIGLIGINKYAKFLNFACDLHIYAFQQFLAQHGYESTVLDYKPVSYGAFDMRHPVDYAESRLRETIARTPKSSKDLVAQTKDARKWAELTVGYRSVAAERAVRYDKFAEFIRENLIFTDRVYDSDLLEVEDPGFDAYMCVTDVIWQSVPKYVFDRGFLLGSKAFEGKPKISYAASRGASSDFTDAEAELFFDYLADIDAISVRERDFGEYIEAHSPYQAPVVLDPVMLHDKPFWQKVSVKPAEERFVLLYYVMEGSADTIQKAVEYARLHDLTLVELSDRPTKFGKVTDSDIRHVSRYDVGMDEWLGYIEHAEAVFTNSFHGCCFSVLFEKTFYVGSRNGQKVPNFLATFGLSDRRFGHGADVSTFDPTIDYDAVRVILDERRRESGGFVLDALKRAEARTDADREREHERAEQKRRALTYPARFHNGRPAGEATVDRSLSDEKVKVIRHAGGGVEYETPGTRYVNDGTATVQKLLFQRPGYEFLGWTLRFRVDNRWFWCLDDGSIAEGDTTGAVLDGRKAVIPEGGSVPHLPVTHVSQAVFVARWRSTSILGRVRDALDRPRLLAGAAVRNRSASRSSSR